MTRVIFQSEEGLRLEGELDAPERPRASLLICHAHPGMQGTMNSPLLVALRDAAVAREIAVLRFNFRGVGESEGTFGDGLAEVADASGALSLLIERTKGAPVAVAGWSFGGAVALRLAAERKEVFCCVAIAPSTRPKEGISAGVPAASELDLAAPVLVIVGSNDEHTPPKDCRAWADEAGAAFLEIKAANHFFWARYERLTEAALAFVQEHLPPGDRGPT